MKWEGREKEKEGERERKKREKEEDRKIFTVNAWS